MTDVCPLPGCRNSTPAAGEPCDECKTAFGHLIQQSERTVDPAEFRRLQAEGDRRVRQIIAERTGGPVRKPNQICWICEERHHCTLIDGRWECSTCQEISP